jgi:putative ABC transport system ATP-binding protein
VELAAGTVLFRQGDDGDLVYEVDEGRIEIVRELAGGGEELLTVVEPGNYFGELAPMFGLRRAATARATSERPAVVTGYSLRDFRTRHSDLATSALLGKAADAVVED